MTAEKLLMVEAIFHGLLALFLLAMPQVVIWVIGWPTAPSTFWPRLLGGVLLGLAVATLVTVSGWTRAGTAGGIGLGAEIPINLTVAFILVSMLVVGPTHPTRRGAVFTAMLAGVLMLLALVEIAYV